MYRRASSLARRRPPIFTRRCLLIGAVVFFLVIQVAFFFFWPSSDCPGKTPEGPTECPVKSCPKILCPSCPKCPEKTCAVCEECVACEECEECDDCPPLPQNDPSGVAEGVTAVDPGLNVSRPKKWAYLDVGTGWGDDIEWFFGQDKNIRKMLPESAGVNSFELHMFEVNLDVLKNVQRILGNYPQDLPDGTYRYHVNIPSAAWDREGFVTFKAKQGRSAEEVQVKAAQETDSDAVPTIDLAKYLEDHFIESDYVVMKMNVEGAEMVLLPHLYKSDSCRLINRLAVSCHTHVRFPPLNPHIKTTEQRERFTWAFSTALSEHCGVEMIYCPAFVDRSMIFHQNSPNEDCTFGSPIPGDANRRLMKEVKYPEDHY